MKRLLLTATYVVYILFNCVPLFAQTLPIRVEVRDQCTTPTCWLHATTESLDYYGTIKYGTAVNFNIDFLLMHEIRGRALARYLGFQTPLLSGGRMLRALALALEHGLIPESAWKPRKPIVLNAGLITLSIEALLVHYQNATPQERVAHQREFMAQVDAVFVNLLGPIPERFDFNGRSWRPLDLSHDLLAGSEARHFRIREVNWQIANEKTIDAAVWQNIIARDGQLKKIELALDQMNLSKYKDAAALDHIAEIISTESRPVLLSIATRDTDNRHTYLETPQTKNLYASAMPAQETYSVSHLIYVAGVGRDSSGAMELTVQNSHGLEDGNQGLRTMLSGFFQNHALAFQDYLPPWFDCQKLLHRK